MEAEKRQRLISQCRENGNSSKLAKYEVICQVILHFLLIGSLMILLVPEVESLTINFPCCSGWKGCSTLLILRFSAVYIFFLIFCAIFDLMRSFSNRISPGLWFSKILFIFFGCWVSTYIQPPIFDRTWRDFLLFGATAFIVLQIYVLIRFSYYVIIQLQRRVEDGFDWAHRVQIAVFISGVVVPILGVILLLHYYPLCDLNILFFVTNAAIPFVACLWSMSDCVRAANGYAGFAQGGVFASFVIFNTWSTLTSDPDPTCNPYFGDKRVVLLSKCLFLTLAHSVYIIGVLFSHNIYVQMEEANESIKKDEERTRGHLSGRGANVLHEDIIHVYNPSFAGFFSAATISFVAISLLDWAAPEISEDVENDSKTAMWCKFIGCWLSVLFFVITLYTPRLYGIHPKKCLLSDP